MRKLKPSPLVEPMAEFFVEIGLPTIAGRLFGYLLLCSPAEQNATQLAHEIQASAGSVHSMLRMLMGLGLVTRSSRPGSRQYLYQIRPEAWADLLYSRLRLVSRLKDLAQLGIDCAKESNLPGDRVKSMRNFYSFFEMEMTDILDHFMSQQAHSPKQKRVKKS